MIFHRLQLAGVFEIHLEIKPDERGIFARSWCRHEFEANNLNPGLVQCSISVSTRKGTLRGMHYQAAPYQETKVIRCTRGAIYDVVLDLRPQSPTFRKWIAATLTAANRKMLYVPEGCAHGFLTLEDETEVFYQMSEFYHLESARGGLTRLDFGIHWPGDVAVAVISERDRTYPDFV